MSLKEVKNRINSVKSTRQITSAMKMVSSAKLHKAQNRIASLWPYQHKLNEILTNFLRTDATFESPYTDVRPVSRVAIVAFSSNGSLCGSYNSNVCRKLEQTLASYQSLGRSQILIYPIGRKVEEAVRKLGYQPQGSYQQMADKPSYADAYRLATELMCKFASHEVDRVVFIYLLLSENYLPIDTEQIASAFASSHPAADAEERTYANDYIVEPSVSQLISALLPKVLSQQLFTVLLDSNTSEHAARMLAMQTATDNANELIQDLTKQYNKTRQQAITNELLDIIGGSMR